jgi:hypothetical protein
MRILMPDGEDEINMIVRPVMMNMMNMMNIVMMMMMMMMMMIPKLETPNVHNLNTQDFAVFTTHENHNESMTMMMHTLNYNHKHCMLTHTSFST